LVVEEKEKKGGGRRGFSWPSPEDIVEKERRVGRREKGKKEKRKQFLPVVAVERRLRREETQRGKTSVRLYKEKEEGGGVSVGAEQFSVTR